MIIEEPEQFKGWLTKVLTPICDADPAALAKYIVALVKKEKPEDDLKELCKEQLDVFLQDKTEEFVSTLFVSLGDKSYLKADLAPVSTDGKENSKAPAQQTDTKKRTKSDEDRHVRVKEVPDDRDRDPRRRRSRSRSRSPRDGRRRFTERPSVKDRLGPAPTVPPPPSLHNHPPPPRDRYPHDGNFRGRRRTRSRSRSRSLSPRPRHRSWDRRPRSRSRSWSRSRSFSRSRSRSRSRSPRRRSYSPRDDYRVRKAPADSTPSPRTDFRHHSPGPWRPPPPRRQRCRDYDEKGFCMRGDLCQFDHGVDPVIVEDVNLPKVLSFPGGPNPPTGPPGPPRGPPGPPRGPPGPPRGPPPPGAVRHPGPPPPRGPPAGMPGPPHGMEGPVMPRPPLPGGPGGPPPMQPQPRPPMEGYQGERYNPEAPHPQGPPPFWQGGPGGPRGPPPERPPHPGHPPHMMIPPRQRDLVTITPVDNGAPPQHPHGQQHHQQQHQQHQHQQEQQQQQGVKRPYHNNVDRQPPAKRPNMENKGGYKKAPFDPTNCTLEVRKIPSGFNNIAKLNEHFGKFGIITNLQVSYEGDSEGALVTYASNGQAAAAYRCPDPVFNNRFIKVFWHNKDQESNNSGPKQESHKSVKDRLGIPPPHKLQLNNTKVQKPTSTGTVSLTPTGNLTKTVINQSALHTEQPQQVQTHTHSTAAPVPVNPKRKVLPSKYDLQKMEVMKKQLEIQKQKQLLLGKQLQQQKMLISKLETNKNLTTEEKNAIMKTIKTVADSIEKLKTEATVTPLQSAAPSIPAVPHHPHGNKSHHEPVSPTDAQKEILDTELELMTQQSTGADTTDLRQKLNSLKKEAASLGLISRGGGRGRGRGRGYMRGGRGRGYGRGGGFHTIDRRSKQLSVTGFNVEDKEELEGHFSAFGQLESVVHLDEGTRAIISFATRQQAEEAMCNGSRFGSSGLVMSWFKPGAAPNPPPQRRKSSIDATALLEEDVKDTEDHAEAEDLADEEDDILDEDLLLGGEEDDEDDEDRGWKR
ncbi:unnamed protein product [Owenia fusiformis]|uniref:C3H1-type domain-containing protein n=1 Tax=Owenia fusiformis TaxID=6347 RepID=A0A8S4N8S3_OWEFU|nr:unnamed protein product [Owenia fusiformis]